MGSWTPWGYDLLSSLAAAVIGFTFYYPFFMSYLWMIGGIHYFMRFERGNRSIDPPPLSEYPAVSILVPMCNEGDRTRETVEQLSRVAYPDFEIVVVNDGSTDRTGAILDQLLPEFKRLRVVHHAQNQGKAVALNTAATVAKNEILVCIDGDALLHEHAVTWFVWHFLNGPRLGGVTGNPRVRNRSTLLGKIQVGEYSSIIGLIKRAQRVYGRVYTVSGVVCAFRRRALHEVGYWDPEMLTEDIDISWKLQIQHWDIRYEPRAVCWILMPETLRGLWRQRLRWATGGVQVMVRHSKELLSWRKRRMWGIYVEALTSVTWAYIIGVCFILWIVGLFIDLPLVLRVPSFIPQWTGVLIGMTCLLQTLLAMCIDSAYDRRLGRVYYWMIWYPLVYWLINMLTTVCAIPTLLLRHKHARARWVSPDRGIGG